MCLLPSLPSLGLVSSPLNSLWPFPSLPPGILRWRVGLESSWLCGAGFVWGLVRSAGGWWCQLAAGVASPHRQLLGGPGRQGRLPHVPTAEGQEDGRPPSSPLCLLQQDRTFCGEALQRLLPLPTPWEAVLQLPGRWAARRGEAVLMAQSTGRIPLLVGICDSPGGGGRGANRVSLPRGRKPAGMVRFHEPLLFLPRSKRFLGSSCRKTWPLMTSCSWTPGTRWVKDRR